MSGENDPSQDQSQSMSPLPADETEASDQNDADRIVPRGPSSRAGETTAIVGIGASAGGLEALSTLFSSMPVDTGASFVVVQHLSPTQKSHMAELLARTTSMPVKFATEGMLLEANSIVVMPSDRHLIIEEGKLHLVHRSTGRRGVHLPIDLFFESLAREAKSRAIAIVLSGTGADGTIGLREVKLNGGGVIVQSEDSAQFDGMPHSAIATGLADFIQSPEEIPEKLTRLIAEGAGRVGSTTCASEDEIDRILAVLVRESEIDFSDYKRTTIGRRLERRIALTQTSGVGEYEALLKRSPAECRRLSNECLIHVTRFFRDTDSWVNLRGHLAPLVENADSRRGIRIWVTACSTGEEAYSLAIALEETFERIGKRVPYKIFATDVDAGAIETAGNGIYGELIGNDLPVGGLTRWFTQNGDEYQISRSIRECVIFAQHNLLRDPPFAKMDLITCRNMLIYLEPRAQRKVIGVFKFALVEQGLLFLGTSENLGECAPDFECLDTHNKLFRILPGVRSPLGEFAMPDPSGTLPLGDRREVLREPTQLAALQTDLIERAMPPTIFVDEGLRLVQSFGNVGPYLQMHSGSPSLDVQKLARGELSVVLATAVRRSFQEDQEIVFDNVRFSAEGSSEQICLRLRVFRLTPIPRTRPMVAIQLETCGESEAPISTTDLDDGQRGRVADLERELQFTRESLQSTVEELETTNQELQALNEELISSNEELQSTNEELQSMNEELHTVNSEHQLKIEELNLAGDDFANLMRVTSVGAIFLDEKLRIRRFTDASADIVALVNGDIGRPIEDFRWRVHGRDIVAAARTVLEEEEPQRFFVEGGGEQWYWISLLPYAPIDSKINGVVITSTDLTEPHYLQELEHLHETVLAGTMPIAIASTEGQIVRVNRSFGELTGRDPAGIDGNSIETVLGDQLAEQVSQALTEDREWEGSALIPKADGANSWVKVKIQPLSRSGRSDAARGVLTFMPTPQASS